jgi:branched-chain amino acid transport system ATP-binding protein
MSGALLEVRGLHAGYGSSEVLFGIDLDVAAGAIVGVLGRNGMGKTTLVRSLMGLLPPSAGRVAFDGTAIAGWPANRVARRGIALVPEGRQVFANLSVAGHLSAFARASPSGDVAWTPARVLALFPALQARLQHFGNQLSGGEQQMLAIGRALVTNPRLLLLDEATEGLAPLVREQIWRAPRSRRLPYDDRHRQVVERLVAISDHHVIVEKGRVAWRGSSAELAADRSLWQRYLGA